MAPQTEAERIAALEMFNRQCEEDRRDLWHAHERELEARQKAEKEMADKIDSLERTRDTLNGVKAALWFIAAAFVGILGALIHVTQLVAAGTK